MSESDIWYNAITIRRNVIALKGHRTRASVLCIHHTRIILTPHNITTYNMKSPFYSYIFNIIVNLMSNLKVKMLARV